MPNINYMKDTRKFWKAREKARVALDKKRVTDSYTEKAKIAEKLHSDANFLKSGRIASAKS